jgi:xanthine dehydrogenase accessory factor
LLVGAWASKWKEVVIGMGAEAGTIFRSLLAAQEAGQPVVLATIVKARGSVPRHAGSKMLVFSDGRIEGTIGGGEMEARIVQEAAAALADGRSRLVPYSLVEPERGDPGVCGGEVEIYLEPYLSPATVVVIGCGHVGRAVAYLASWLGFRVVAGDDRPDLATPEQTPGADVYLSGELSEIVEAFTVTGSTYIVLATRNVLVDRQILPHLAATPAPFIGVIGSRRRWQETQRLLRADGMTDDQLARIHSPIGLELNAETPEEIAVSILAEIIMTRRGGSGEHMAHHTSPAKQAQEAL